MWGIALMVGLLILAAKPAKPKAGKTIKLRVGHTYRLKARVISAQPALTEKMLDGIRQGLEVAGMRDVRTSLGPPPSWEYTQVTQVETEIELNSPITITFEGQVVTFEFLWATEISIPGV